MEVDALLTQPLELHCIGGFAINIRYGFPRTTGDIDFCSLAPLEEHDYLIQIAGPGSELHRKYHLCFHCVYQVNLPEDYNQRLQEVFRASFQHLRLFVPDPYDLALSKLERNHPKDREDVEYLAKTIPLKAATLCDRYRKELRPYLVNEERHDNTIDLWIDACFQSE